MIRKQRMTGLAWLASAVLFFNCLPVKASTVERYTKRTCYAVGTAAFASAASATNIFTLFGSATRTIVISRIEMTGTQTTAGQVLVRLIKYSTAVTGGTPVAATAVPLDSTTQVGSATTATNLATYTANPTPGTAVGTIKAQHMFVPAPASVAEGDTTTIWEELPFGKPIVLNGVAEGIGIDLNAVTVTGGSFVVSVQYEEQ